MKKHPVLETVSFLSGLGILPQIFITGVFLVLVGALLWVFVLPNGHSGPNRSSASYEGLDPEARDYWFVRAERDIDAARSTEGTAKSEEHIARIRDNLSATIREATKITEPAKRNLALVAIIQAQLSRNVGANLREAFSAMEKSPETRRQRASVLSELAWYYIQEKDRTNAMQMVREYVENLQAYQFDPGDPQERASCEEIMNACIVLGVNSQAEALFLHLQYTAQTARSDQRKSALLSFLALMQLRKFDYDAAFESASKITVQEQLAEVFRKMLELRAGISSSETDEPITSESGDYFHNKIRYPQLFAETAERIYESLAKNQRTETQKDVLRMIFESEMMAHRELRALLRETLIASPSVDSGVKTYAIGILDNPRSETLRLALGMPAYTEDPNAEINAQDLKHEAGVSEHPAMSREKMLQEDIRVLVNTSQELLKWGKTREARPLLRLAALRNKSLDFDPSRPNSSITIAGIMIAAGDVENAKDTLAETRELLSLYDEGQANDPYLAQVAQIQLRARLLEESRLTATKMIQGTSRSETLRQIVLEQLRIARFADATKTLREMPPGKQRDELAKTVSEVQRRLERKAKENVYENAALEKILRDENLDDSKKQTLLQRLAELQLEEPLLVDARETVRKMSDVEIRSTFLVKIVNKTIDLVRPYSSEEPLHREVRRTLFQFGFDTAREIPNPAESLACMERLYTRNTGFVSEETMEPSLLAILTLLDEIPGQTQLKSETLLRVIQARMRSEAEETLSLIGGPWCVFSAKKAVTQNDPAPEFSERTEVAEEPPQERDESRGSLRALYEKRQEKLAVHSALLLKAGLWVRMNESAEERLKMFAMISSLFYQLDDHASGQVFFESALEEVPSVPDQRVVSVTLLTLAQARLLGGEEESAKMTFQLAVEAADRIYSPSQESPTGAVDRRTRERILTDIARGQAELGRIHDAMETTRLVEEEVFLDRLFKTIGYLQLAQGQYEDAEETFHRLGNARWKTLCLKDLNFRKRLNAMDEE